jgi:16S rRNA C1402 (ribose-2'-O) methylase RsmI
MRPYDDYDDELDEIDAFAGERTRALQKLLDEYRQEERRNRANNHLGHFKSRRHNVNWNWEDEDDWD